jgi:release factor glutamine methyltransferase
MQQEESLMHHNVLLHEPHTALFVPNNNALVFYEAIATFANEKLEVGGYIFVEINEALGVETCNLFTEFGFETILKKDLQGKDRMIKAWKN